MDNNGATKFYRLSIFHATAGDAQSPFSLIGLWSGNLKRLPGHISKYTMRSLVVDETRHGVRDVAVNVRGAAVARIEQTIYARKNIRTKHTRFLLG